MRPSTPLLTCRTARARGSSAFGLWRLEQSSLALPITTSSKCTAAPEAFRDRCGPACSTPVALLVGWRRRDSHWPPESARRQRPPRAPFSFMIVVSACLVRAAGRGRATRLLPAPAPAPSCLVDSSGPRAHRRHRRCTLPLQMASRDLEATNGGRCRCELCDMSAPVYWSQMRPWPALRSAAGCWLLAMSQCAAVQKGRSSDASSSRVFASRRALQAR